MKNLVGLLVLFFIFSVGVLNNLNAQVLDPVLGPRAWQKENNEQREAITLTHIREADVMWSTRVWRVIDLRQKINHPLYFPDQDSAIHGKRSFIQILYDLYLNNPANFGPNGVKLYENSEFERTYSYEQLKAIVQREDSVQIINPLIGCIYVDTVVQIEWNKIKREVTKVTLMEDWFFDKQRSVMDVRILGLGLEFPMYTIKTTLDPFCQMAVFEDYDKVQGGKNEVWFFFPQIRQELAVLECYKRQNDAARLSYDDIFLQRIFASYIIREENVYDRSISDYTAGLDALLEAENIKTKIFEFEQNVWQY